MRRDARISTSASPYVLVTCTAHQICDEGSSPCICRGLAHRDFLGTPPCSTRYTAHQVGPDCGMRLAGRLSPNERRTSTPDKAICAGAIDRVRRRGPRPNEPVEGPATFGWENKLEAPQRARVDDTKRTARRQPPQLSSFAPTTSINRAASPCPSMLQVVVPHHNPLAISSHLNPRLPVPPPKTTVHTREFPSELGHVQFGSDFKRPQCAQLI